MDPITLILRALATGSVKASGNTVYKVLKALIQEKFAGKPEAERVLNEYEKDPLTYEALLKMNLVEAGVDKDEEILKVAEDLLRRKPLIFNKLRDFVGMNTPDEYDEEYEEMEYNSYPQNKGEEYAGIFNKQKDVTAQYFGAVCRSTTILRPFKLVVDRVTPKY